MEPERQRMLSQSHAHISVNAALFATTRPGQRSVPPTEELKQFYSDSGRSAVNLPVRTFSEHLNLRHWSTNNITKTKGKTTSEFLGLEPIQQKAVYSVASRKIWVLKFSPNGEHLAVAGDEPTVLLLPIVREPSDGCQLLLQDAVSYRGHTDVVIDIAWSSASSMFLSASADCKVLLWVLDDTNPKMEFKHPSYVTCVAFHPQEPDYILTGCFDRMLRVWNLPDGDVKCQYKASDYINSGTFSPNGTRVVAGLSHGHCAIYELNLAERKLAIVTVIPCRNRRGFLSGGRDIVGVQFLNDYQFLVTTNDSCLRLFDLRDFSIKQKYKGTVNKKNPIRGSFSHNLSHVICGSDSGEVFIWSTAGPHNSRTHKNAAVEFFRVTAQKDTAVAVFAPARTIELLQDRITRARSDLIVTHVIVAAAQGSLFVYYNQFRPSN